MLKRASILLGVGLLATFGFAKNKTKNTLPAYVLHAKTVAVIIDRDAGTSMDDPEANQVAQKDVEAAILSWGRFDPVSDTEAADLIIVVHKGNGHLMNDALPDPRQTNRTGAINPTDRGGPLGAQRGPQPGLSGEPGFGPDQETPRSQTEIGDTEDSFAVFKGGEKPRDSTPVWRYVMKDGLRPHTVPAVAAFRQAVADADKAAKNPE